MEITYQRYSKENLKLALELWNDEVGFIFPISKKLFKQNIENCKYYNKEASLFAFSLDKLVGFILPKVWDKDKMIEQYLDNAWISLFYVSRDFRKKGIGSSLFDFAEKELKKQNVKEIHIGRDINNFFPALPCDFDNSSFTFLEERGYLPMGITHDTIKKCDSKYFEVSPNIKIRFALESEKEEVLNFLKKNFPGRWYYEAYNYFDAGGYVIAIVDQKIVGFMRVNYKTNKDIPYNMTYKDRFKSLGGLGPLGVCKEYRKMGIGSNLISWSINYLMKEKASHIMIDWTSLLAYYQKYGFEVWKCYRYYKKNI